MFRGDLLIDGYNLLHAAGLAQRSYGPGEFERTRRRLLQLLAGQLNDRERRRTTVVFDAPKRTLGPSPTTTIYGIRVLFADRDADADAAIERLIRHNSAPRRLHVISSDHRVQKAARRRRAKALDSETFLARIVARPTPEERARQAEPPEKREGITAAGEVDVWLREFAGVSRDIAPQEPSSRNGPIDAQDTADPALPLPSAPDVPGDARRDECAPHSEVTFWERRIAELWDQTDDDAG